MFTKDDLTKYNNFKKVIHECDLKVEGKAVVVTALLFQWFNELGAKIESEVNKPKKKPGIKKEPIKKD